MFIPRFLRPAALLALSLASAPCARAATPTIQVPHAIGLAHAQVAPYNFSGRLFDFTDTGGGFGTGTLIRRHTVLTAAHVVFDPAAGFITNATFSRAKYEGYQLSTSQIISVSALAGYQAAVTSTNNGFLATTPFDQGYVLLRDAPAFETWGNYLAIPALLASTATQLYVLGYPGVTFDGLTLAYIVPTAAFTPLGATVPATAYVNTSYIAEPGMSGGPIYYVQDTADQYVVATTVGGNADTTGIATGSFVRVIDKAANKAIIAAEYASGLIKRVKVTGPKTVMRGQTYTYDTNVVFATPANNGAKVSTTRYAELKLQPTSTISTTSPEVTIKKTSNTTFAVTFNASARPNSVLTLQVFYERGLTPLGNSSITVQVQ